MILYVEHETDTAHRLSCHKGKCQNLHGHRYRFVLGFEVKGTIEDGEKFKDFYDVKKTVRETLDWAYDHGTVLKDCSANRQLIDVLEANSLKVRLMANEPTVEAMCKAVSGLFEELGLVSVTIYETPTNYCSWKKEDR